MLVRASGFQRGGQPGGAAANSPNFCMSLALSGGPPRLQRH
jgi:hypothetical protein